jgi:hypothetical protein
MGGRRGRGESAVIAALLSLSCALLVGPIDAFLGSPTGTLWRRNALPMSGRQCWDKLFVPQFGDAVPMMDGRRAPICFTKVRAFGLCCVIAPDADPFLTSVRSRLSRCFA